MPGEAGSAVMSAYQLQAHSNLIVVQSSGYKAEFDRILARQGATRRSPAAGAISLNSTSNRDDQGQIDFAGSMLASKEALTRETARTSDCPLPDPRRPRSYLAHNPQQ